MSVTGTGGGGSSFNPLSLISGVSGLLTALFPDTTKTSGQTNSSGTTSGTTSATSTPQMSTLQQMLSNMFGAQAMNASQNVPGVVQATKTAGEQAIGQTETAAQNNVSNTLAARGLAYSPYAGTAMAAPSIAAAGEQSSLLQSLPLLQSSLQNTDIQQLMSAMGATGPVGTSATGKTTGTTSATGTTSGTQTQQGILGSLFNL